MQLHQIKPVHKPKKTKRIGRGGKKGTYSGRGMKGQKSRAGRKLPPVIRELIKKYPKLRSYKEKLKFTGWRSKPIVLNLDVLEKNFKAKERVSVRSLLEKGLISKTKGKLPKVKILGKGDISKSLSIEGCLFSKSVKQKIEKAGGEIK